MVDLGSLKTQAQRALVQRGYHIGTTGPNHDGVDGDPGDLTWQAIVNVLISTPIPAAAPPPPLAPTRLPGFDPVEAISVELLKLVADPQLTDSQLELWIEPLKAACRRFEINTIRRVAAFISQLAHESGLLPRSENLNYSVEGLLATFSRERISREDCARYGRSATQKADQQAIANLVYGGSWGALNLGNTQPGDGWLFRGTGPLQVTGRANFTRFAKAMGMGLDAALSYAHTLEGGIMAAAWFWEENDINRLADTPGVSDETKRINGGYNGLSDRKAKFDKVVEELLRLEGGAQ